MPQFDAELTQSQLSDLANADRLAEFFHYLGYDTNGRVKMTIEALGLGDSLKHEVESIERIAAVDNLQVYLFVLRSVTQANINALARAFRNKVGEYLFVLTKDFEELDFVLLERQVSVTESSNRLSRSNTQATMRPRTLSVKRRNPGEVQLKVLRRFTNTEQDVYAQFEKLRAAYDVAYWAEPLFNNRALFSDYFLKHRLRATKAGEEFYPTWHTEVKPTFQRLRELYAGVRTRLGNADEARVRAELIEPVLRDVLGFRVQDGGTDKDAPSYLLYGDDAGQPLAVCLAYRWGRNNLDSADIDPQSNEPEASRSNPTARAVSLMEDGKADWVIVTNGKLWRLYAAQAHSRATNYYEIDLEESLSRQEVDPDALKYWLLLFRAAAFVPQAVTEKGQTRQMSLLQQIMAGSESYAKDLGDRLKERIFEDVFPYFAEGFIRDMRAQGRGELDEGDRRAVFQGTLTFLYRLLFLLYAESRGLLPVNEQHGYWEISLERLKAQIAEHGETTKEASHEKLSRYYSPTATDLYDQLAVLFRAIDAGDSNRNVPIYNGGLFLSNPSLDDSSAEAANARFLSTYAIPDRYLALGLDALARDQDTKTLSLAVIDYKSLGVRQLGSIYEGILEFTVQVAAEKMAVVRGKKNKEELILPYAEAVRQGLAIIKKGGQERTYAKGDVYLENDKHKRKVSGSYYTPDYIVEYIVAHTVGPVLDAKLEALRGQLRQAQMTYFAEQEKAKRLGLPNADNQAYLKHKELADAVFDLRVLDPAMGSGHFLVEAVDFITDRILKFLAAYPWNPITHALKQSRTTILAAMEAQAVSIDAARLTDTNLLKRQVLKRCIYGVDLNPMAVELAKVSLWLDCFTLGAPLSFLDHHMKCGNSLIGAQVEEARQVIEQGQLSMFAGNLFAGAMLATDLMRQVGELPDATAEQVRQSRSEYRQANNQLAPFKRILDIYTSRWFGNTAFKTGRGKTAQVVDPAIYFLRTRENEAWLTNPSPSSYAKLNLGDRKVADTATVATQQYRFFHWELEFPEVFFAPTHAGSQVIQRKAAAGFDAVIGNPPYVRQESLSSSVKDNLRDSYPKVYASAADLYVFFFAQGLHLLRKKGNFGIIAPNKFLQTEYGVPVRNFLRTNMTINEIIDFGELPVFPDAGTFPAVYLVSQNVATEHHNVLKTKMKQLPSTSQEMAKMITQAAVTELQSKMPSGTKSWSTSGSGGDIIAKMELVGTPLSHYIGGSMRRGVLTGRNEAFVIDELTKDAFIAASPSNKDILKPFLDGDDVRHYNSDFKYRYLIWTYVGVPIENYKAILNHLKQFQAALEKRTDQGNHWWELRHCSYYADFEKPKIIYPEMAKESRFTFDEEGYFTNKTAFIIPNGSKYLLALLNSKLVWLYLKRACASMGDVDERGRLNLQSIYIEQIPIFVPQEATSSNEKAELLDSLVAKTSNGTEDANISKLAEVDRLIAANQQDVVADFLAHLTDVMLKLNKQRQVEVRRFLAHLEGQLGAKVDTLSRKTTVQEYAGDYQKNQPPAAWQDIARVLAKNAAKHRLPLVETALAAEYERSLATLAPITTQLAATDRLIDQIVYKLYGLTDEEIAVVEGKSQ